MAERDKNKTGRAARFNFADAIIAGVLLIVLFAVLVGLFSQKPESGRVLEIKLPEEQRAVYLKSGLSPDAGTEVRDFDGKEKIGVLSEKYESGGDVLQVLVKTGQDERNLWQCGQKISLTVGNMIVYDAVITDVRKDG